MATRTQIENAKIEDLIAIVSKANKETILFIFTKIGQTPDTTKSLEELRTELTPMLIEILKVEVSQITTKELANKKSDSTPIESLVKQAESLVNLAGEINAKFESLTTQEERDVFLSTLDEQFGLLDHLKTFAPNIGTSKSALIATDLPKSTIFTTIPTRVLEQVLYGKLVNYPLMQLVKVDFRDLGAIDIFYKDFRDVDSKSGSSDVEIADYNMGTEPIYKETYRVDTNIHKGFDILDSVLNDITLSIGLFVALVKDFAYAITHPIAKKMYSRFIDFLDVATNYDEVITFDVASTTTVLKAKEIHNKIISLSTPSRTNLTQKPDGATKALEYAINPADVYIILNKKYAVDYRYDLTASTFNLGEINLGVKGIKVLDFDKLEEYSSIASGSQILKTHQVIIMDSGVYNEMIQYQATKLVETPKLKQVFHSYTRIGNYRRKDKLLIAYK